MDLEHNKPTILLSLASSQPPTYGEAVVIAGGSPIGGYLPSQGIPNRFDGLLLGGGGDLDPAWYGAENIASEPPDLLRDQLEAQLIFTAIRTKVPILGICRGMQVLNGVLGGTLIQDLGVTHSMTDGQYRLHQTRIQPGTRLARLYGTRAVVNSGHHQAVETVAPDFAATQWAYDGVIEAIEHQTLPLVGVQWHPERLCGTVPPQQSVNGMTLFRALIACCGGDASPLQS